MREIIWAIAVASLLAGVSVYASDKDESSYENASVEVGFSQDGEPEPHLLAVSQGDEVKLYEVTEKPTNLRRKLASAPAVPSESAESTTLSKEIFLKRMHQVVDSKNFFTARQPKPKRKCHDQYVLRIKVGDQFRERRGCGNQTDDPFAEFSQLMFRDAFVAIRASKSE